MIKRTKRMLVISFDCLSSLDVPFLQSLSQFQSLFKEGAYARQVKTVYPSLTYPCHTTLVTGNYPKKHGIINNTLLQPGRDSPDWNWFRKNIKGTTLYDEAKKAGFTTASLLWPVTGGASIDYNLPEIFPNRPWQSQTFVSLKNGSPLYQWQLNKKFGYIRQGLSQPALDDFVLASAIHTIHSIQPELMFIHFTDLDTQRHMHGFSSPQATDALLRHHLRLENIISALKNMNLYEETTLILLGDHSALDENKAIHVNTAFKDNGLIRINKRGKLKDWKAFCKSCDGSAYIYVKDKNDYDITETVHSILSRLTANPDNGIENIYSATEAASFGADPNCLYMLEASKGFYFLEDCDGEYVKTITREDVCTDKKYTFATHGYSPEKDNYTTFFMAVGPGIQSGQVIPHMHLVDVAPTLAELLGVSLGDTDGRILSELLN